MMFSITLIAIWLDKIERDLYGVEEGIILNGQDISRLLDYEIRDLIEEEAIKIQILPENPKIDRINGEIISEKEGQIIDIESTINRIFNAKKGEKVDFIIIKVKPKYNSSDLEKIKEVIGYYETYFRGSSARYNNIVLAIQSLNNTLVWPGETFSFNEHLGPRTAERGYMPAPVIISGGIGEELGGGICQVSSTLYNAVVEADLKIIERHPHSKEIHYVPYGKDAAVDYASKDFSFKNSSNDPIIIKTSVDGSKIIVNIMGRGKK